MLESLAAWVLNTYIGDYVENLSIKQLSIALLQGKLELENLPLKRDALKKLNFPVEVRSGFIGRVHLQIPVSRLKSQPWVITLDKLYLVAGPLKTKQYNEEDEKQLEWSRKHTQLTAQLEQWRNDHKKKDAGYSWWSMGTSLASNIVENLQLNVKDVHLRYEDETCIPGRSFACGVIIRSLSAHSTNENGVPMFVGPTSSNMRYKLVDLQDFSVYWDTDTVMLGELPREQLKEQLERTAIHSPRAQIFMDHEYLVEPVSAQAKMRRNVSPLPLRISCTPRVALDITLDKFVVALSEQQYRDMVLWMKEFDRYDRAYKYRKWRPTCSVHESPSKWWKFAITAQLETIHDRNQRHSMKYVVARVHDINTYAEAFTEYLALDPRYIDDELKAQMEEVEQTWTFQEMRGLREVLLDKFSREEKQLNVLTQRTPSRWRWLRQQQQGEEGKSAKPIPEQPEPEGSSPEPTPQRPGLFSYYFPGWTNWKAADKPPGAGEGAGAGEEADAQWKIEQEIMDVLQDNAENNTLLKRDAVFAHLNFTLEKGTLKLLSSVSTPSDTDMSVIRTETILELECDAVGMEFESRPRTKGMKFSITVGGLYLRDHITAHSIMPVLVAPQMRDRSTSGGWHIFTTGSPNDDHTSYGGSYRGSCQSGVFGQSSPFSQTTDLFTLMYEQNPFHSKADYKLEVKAKPLDIVCNPAAIKRVMDFFAIQHRHGLHNRDLAEVAKLHYLELKKQTQAEIKETLDQFLEGNEQVRAKRWDCELDISAPQFILAENFTDPRTMMVVFDLGHLHFRNKAAGIDPTFRSSRETSDDTDDDFVTPCSSPPSSDAEDDSADMSFLLKSEDLSEMELYDKIYDKYTLNLCDVQMMVGRGGREHWKYAHLKGTSPLHIVNKFTISLQLERRLLHTCDPKWPKSTLSGTVQSLVLNVNEQKIRALHTCINLLTSEVSPSSSEVHVSTSQKSVRSTTKDSTVITDSSLDIGSLYRACSKSITSIPEATAEDQQRSRLVAESRLVLMQFGIHQMSLQLQSRGRSVAEVHVGGVKANFTKRVYDMSLSFTVHSLLVADALQTFGPDYELLIASHKNICLDTQSGSLRDSEPNSPSSPQSPLFPASPGEPVKPTGSTMSTSLISIQSAVSSALQTLTNSIPGNTETVTPVVGQSKAPHAPSLTQSLNDPAKTLFNPLLMSDSEALIKVELEVISPICPTNTNEGETLHIANVQINNLDVIANQQTLVELISFVKRVIPQFDNPTQFMTSPQGSNKDEPNIDREDTGEPELSSRWEVHADFNRLSMMMMRVVEVDGYVTARKVATATMSQAKIWATIARDMKIEGSLGGLQLINLTPECSRHQKVFSVGHDPSMATSEQKTNLNESLFSDSTFSEKAFTFMFAKEYVPCLERSSLSHLGQNFVLTLRMASLCYTHSPQFLHEMALCMTEFREYMVVVGRSIKERATEVARTFVTLGADMGTGLSHYGSSESIDMGRRQRQRFSESAVSQENSANMSRQGSDQLTLFKMNLDAVLQTPVIVLPRSGNSSQVLVLHLGRISIQNSALSVSTTPPLYQPSFNCDTSMPAPPAEEKIFVEVRDMTIYSIDLDKQQYLEQRLSRGINQFSTPQPGGYTKTSYGTPILHNTCVELSLELGQVSPAVCVKFNVGVTDDDVTEGVFPMHTQDDGISIQSVKSDEILHIKGKVVTPLRLVLSKHVYEQLLETMNNLTPDVDMASTYADSTNTLMADSSDLLDKAGIPTHSASSNVSRSSSLDQTPTATGINVVGTSQSSKSIALNVITVKFAMPIFNIQLTGDVGEGEEGFLDMKFQEFFVNLEKSDSYITSVNISLQSLIVEDLLEHKDSRHRHLVTSYSMLRRRSSTSSDSNKRFCSTSCPTSMLETPLPDMPNSLPSVFCEENVFADYAPRTRSAGKMEARRSISLVNCPMRSTPKTEEEPRKKSGVEPDDDEDLLVHIRVVLVDKKSPQFETTYDKTSRFVTVDFNRLDTTINLQTWVVLLDFLGMGANVDNISTKGDDKAPSMPCHDTNSPPVVTINETGGMVAVKPNMKVDVAVASLSLLLNKADYELALVNVCGFTSQVSLRDGNVSVTGQLASISLRDESPHARLYRERFITTGSQALNFEFFKFGTPDRHLHREFDMSVKLRMTSVCYVHTQRFLLETLAFCQHFLQLQNLLGQMRAASAGWKVMERAVRSQRVRLDIEAGAPKILIPHSSNSTDILVVNLGTLSVSNTFTAADSLGTVREREATESRNNLAAMTQSIYGSLDHDMRGNINLESPLTSHFDIPSDSNSTLNSFYSALGTPTGSMTTTGMCATQKMSPPELPRALFVCGPTEPDPANYKCLLDIMQVVLMDIDLFAAQWRCKEFGGAGGTAGTKSAPDLLEFPSYFVHREEQKLLEETCKLTLQVERNLESEISHTSPDMRVDGTLTAVQCSLDLRQYQLIKGILMHNIGEEVGEFQRPLMSHLQDPQMQTILSGQVWNAWSMKVNLHNVTLELLQSRGDDHEAEVPLARCDFIKSHLVFESFSDGTKDIDLVSHEIVIHDTRYRDAPANARPNVFSKILQPSKNCTDPSALQMELHFRSTKESTRFTVLLNNMRLMGVFDWLLALRSFIMVEVTNPFENGAEERKENSLKRSCVRAHTMSAGVISKRATYVEPKESMFELKVNVTDTEFVVVEDTTAWDTNAVILKCTAVLMYCPYLYERPLTCSLQSLEVFSCCLAAEDDTALSIIDPVTVAMELNTAAQLHKINSPPAGLLDATSPLDRSPILEVCLSSVNIRLSYNDIKLFLAIMDSMPKQLLQASEQSLHPRNKAHSPHPDWQLNKLKALGFSESDCAQALTDCSNCMDDAAYWLIQNAEPIPSAQYKKQQKRNTALSGIEVKADGMCICFIDDCQDADVPLAELNFTSLYCLHRLSGYGNSKASFRLTGDYYNRSLSGWEPFLEMWRCQLHWQTGLLDDVNKVTATAQDVLNLNITSVLLNLYQTTTVKWTEDYYKDTVSRSGYLSSSRRRTPFIPFALRNNTGSELWFTTVISTPSRMEMPLSPGRLTIGSPSSPESTDWKHVKSGEEVSFLIEERQKTRHKNTHELRVHKLVVKVAGWKEVSPLSVDKVGVYFREARPEMDKSSAIFTEVPPARIVFDVTVGSSAKKLITVRSALVIHNRLDDPMEVLLENTLSTVGAKDMVMRVNSGRYMAMPLSMVHCKVRARPFAHSLRWCHRSALWQHVEKAGEVSHMINSCDTVNGPTDSYRFCVQVRRLHYPPDTAIRRSVTSLQQASIYGQPGHVITFMPPVRVDNLLPVDLIYYIKGTDIRGTIKPGRIASLVTADITQALELGVELENFPSCKELVIPAGTKDYKVKLRLYDTAERLLALSVHIKAGTGGSLKLSVSAPYWLVNKTGLPLVFKQDGCSESAAGQFEEHELARSVTPLSFCYARRDQPMLCSMKLGKSVKGPGTLPQWCHKFSLERGIGVRQLHVISNDARPDWVYNIGIEVRQGRGRYCDTNIITFTPRYQLDNRSQHKLAFAQRHLVSGQNPSVDDYLSALPSCTLTFHWPRIDLDQLLCVRMMGDPHYCWSGGFRVDTVDSFHINMRGERNCCMFLRVDIVLHGATYFVVFTDADQMPPPYRIDNYCEVSLVYYQTKVTEERLRSHIKARTSVPYAWDEPMLPPYLTVSVPGGTSATYNMHVLEEGAQLCYENFIYIAFTATFRSSSSLVKGTSSWNSYDAFVESQELVLDVVPGDKVVLKRKEQGKRSQLWRMTSQGMLQHEGSSAPRDPRIKKTSANDVTYVLDIADIALRPSVEVSLILRKPDERRKTTQTWKFTEDGRLCCGPGNAMCVQSKEGVFGLREGGEAVLGPTVPSVATKTDIPIEMMIGRQKMRPGSGFLSVKVITDGPTRVLQIMDVTHQNYLARTSSDWVLIEQERHRPSLKDGHRRLSISSTKEVQEPNFEVVVSLKAGVGISLVNHVPEELVYVTLKNIEVKLSSTSSGQILDASVGNIQVDNQLFGTYEPVLLFVTPPNAESPVEPTPALQVYVHRIPNKKWNADIYKEFLVTLTRMTLHIEEKLLWKLLQLSNFHEMTTELDALNDDENSYNSQRALSAAVSATLKRYYFGRLRANVNRITMSMLTCSQLPHDLLTIKKTLGMPLVKFENAKVELDPFEHNHQFETSAFLLELIKLHYTEELKGQAAKILGSVDFLGNPLGLFNDVTEGIYGLIDGNVGGLLKSVTHGVSNSAAKVAGTLSDGVGIVAFDERHQLVRQEILRETMGNSRQHLMAGVRGFTHGILGGLTSIVTQTYTGTMESGFEGLITGFGKGVVGTVAKPLAGVLDLASGAASAVRDTSRSASHHMQQRARKPRCCFGPRGLLPVYSEHHANAQEYLFTLNKNNYGEMFVAIEQLQKNNEDSVRVLLSSDRVYFLGHHEPIRFRETDHYNIMLDVPYNKLYQCRAIPYEGKFYIELTMKADNEMGVPAIDPKKRPKVRCDSEEIAQKVTSQILYAKNLYDETKQTLPTDDNSQLDS